MLKFDMNIFIKIAKKILQCTMIDKKRPIHTDEDTLVLMKVVFLSE